MSDYGDRPPASAWVEYMRSFLGRRVQVTLRREPPVMEEGVLACFTDVGEALLLGDNGEQRHCWPVLDCRAAVKHLEDRDRGAES